MDIASHHPIRCIPLVRTYKSEFGTVHIRMNQRKLGFSYMVCDAVASFCFLIFSFSFLLSIAIKLSVSINIELACFMVSVYQIAFMIFSIVFSSKHACLKLRFELLNSIWNSFAVNRCMAEFTYIKMKQKFRVDKSI